MGTKDTPFTDGAYMELMLILAATLGVCLLIGVPICFAIGVSVFVGLYYGGIPFSFVAQSSFTALDSFTTMSVPFFILAGSVMETGGLSRRLIGFAQALVGNITGGFGIVTVLACAFFAAICGSSPATVAAIGAIMIPAMIGRGYSAPFAASLTACSGGLGVVIPPSINMIIYSITANVSVADMFLSGFIPGIIITLALSFMAYLLAKKKGYKGSGQPLSLRACLQALHEAKWALLAPVIILGGIYCGLFTPTESAAIAVVYGMIVGFFVYKELNLRNLVNVLVSASTTTGAVVIILATGMAFGRLIARYQIPQLAGDLLIGITDSWVLILLLIAVLLLILGCFMETLSIMIILTPILLPVVTSLGVNPIHFGMIMVLGAEIGMFTPPVGVNLFVASGISGVSLEKLSWAILPFIGTMLALYVLFILVPGITTFLPSLLR